MNFPRPFDIDPNISFPGAKETLENLSFPSGDAQGSTPFWFDLPERYPHPGLGAISATIALLIALSGVYLGVHYPQDAIAVLLTFSLAVLCPSLPRSSGVTIGFFLSSPNFIPPATGKGKLLLVGLGLPIVLGFYGLSKWPIALWDMKWINLWRDLAIVLVTTELRSKIICKCDNSAK